MASLVVFHHSGFFASFFTIGKWSLPSDGLMYIGKVGVYVFFAISAFLFWGKTGASNKKVYWLALYANRFFRIAPLQFFCSALSIILILYFSGFPSHHNVHIKDILPWFDAGLFNSRPDINDYHKSRVIMAGVTWTLQYEWFFYFSLPLIFLIRKLALPASIFALIIFLFFPVDSKVQYIFSLLSCFACGIICQEAYKRIRVKKLTAEVILIMSIASLAIFQPSVHNGKASVLCGLIVYAVVNGASLFGLLSNKGSARLGEVSYSIYLMQGIIFYTFFKTINASGVDIGIFSVNYYLFTFLAFLLLVGISTLTFLFVEKPAIELGRWLNTLMKSHKDNRLA
ncbi:acyltransferase [Cronobacter turicensis]|nr:acyltransferase [Cronobacter turicensis]ELY3628870.1 acyltransferase [Cronobacter turicensis]